MPTAEAHVFHVTGTNDYGYTWKADINQADITTMVTGKTKAQAWTDIGTLVNGMPGVVREATITATST